MLVYWRASEASETALGVDNAKSGICYWRASEASETVLGVDNTKSGICYWRASVASETVLGGIMQNRVYVICIYVCGMVRMPFNRARAELFSPKNTAF